MGNKLSNNNNYNNNINDINNNIIEYHGIQKRLQQSKELQEIIYNNNNNNNNYQWKCLYSKRKIRDDIIVFSRLKSLWKKETKFINKMQNGNIEINKSRLTSSNFPHLHALLCLILSPFIEDICEIIVPLEFASEKHKNNGKGSKYKTNIDIICFSGKLWINIIARKPSQISWRSNSSYSKHGVKEKIQSLILASTKTKGNPCFLLSIPEGVSPFIYNKLQNKYNATQIFFDYPNTIYGNQISSLQPYKTTFWFITPPNHPYNSINISKYINTIITNTIKYINLDTSTLLALTSDVTNGKVERFINYLNNNNNNVKLSTFIVKQLYEEQQSPLLPSLREFLSNYDLIVTDAAYKHYKDIVFKIGSKSEIERGKELLSKIRIFEDINWENELNCPLFSDLSKINRLSNITRSNTLKDFPLEVFGLGDCIPCMITATSNQSIVRALKDHNIYLRVYIHSPRSLITNKFDFI